VSVTPAGAGGNAPAARDAALDRLRGLAVVLMLLANLAPYLAPQPFPVGYRALATFCAPAFVLLAGMMVGRRATPLRDAFARGAVLVAIGALLDVLGWGIAPFRSFDVLYLIGLSLPVAALAVRTRPSVVVLLAAAIFALTAFAHATWGYRSGPPGVPSLLWAALLGGWFPLLPWLAVALLGVAIGRVQSDRIDGAASTVALWGTALFGVGALSWAATQPPLFLRGGYAEFFYPPTFGVLAVFSGVALLALAAFRAWHVPALAVIEPFGRRALPVYGVHVVIIAQVVARLDLPRSSTALLLGFAFLLAVAAWVVWMLDRLRVRPRNALLRQLLGG
jgi:uncharacterized membrane protein